MLPIYKNVNKLYSESKISLSTMFSQLPANELDLYYFQSYLLSVVKG